MSRDVFILGGKRTPMAGYLGALKDVSAIDLGASAARSAMEATEVSPEEIDHMISATRCKPPAMLCSSAKGSRDKVNASN
jgi:acetyl-CoA acetyltransferase